MKAPLWFEWRRQAAAQWYRDVRGIKTYGSVRLPGNRPAAVKGCGSKNIQCALCDHRYNHRTVKFETVMAHMVKEHLAEATVIYLM